MNKAIDVSDPAIFHNEAYFVNPYETYRQLLSAGEIHYLNLYGGMWYLGSYEAVSAVLTDNRVSHDTVKYLAIQFTDEQRAQLSEFIRLYSMWMSLKDGKEHVRLRNITHKAFALSMREIVPTIQTMVDSLSDTFVGKGQVDFLKEFAYHLPALVVMKLIGIPLEDRSLGVACADSLGELFGSTQANFDVALRAQKNLVEMTRYLEELIAKRRLKPENDFISNMLAVEDNGEKLTVDEIHAQCSMLLFAGHETTRNLFGNGLYTLLKHPVQFEKLKENPGHMRTAVQEMLRYDSPVQYTVREATEDMDIYGKSIRQGQPILFCFGSANHDPQKFTSPEVFDITRNESRNLSFGMGIHSCTGAQLALMEAEIAFTSLIKRFPDMKLVDERPNWLLNAGFRGLQDLYIAL